MYVEVKSPSGGKKYVYLKRSVRVGKKIKHITVERYGELQKLERMYPGFVDQLTRMCQEGCHQVFLRKLLSFERGIARALSEDYDYVGKGLDEKPQHKFFNDLVPVPFKNISSPVQDINAALPSYFFKPSPNEINNKNTDSDYIESRGVNFTKLYDSNFDIDMLCDSEEGKHVASILFSKPVTRLFADQQEVLAHTYAPNYEFGGLDELINMFKAYSAYPAFSGNGIKPIERECLYPIGFVDAVVVAAGVGKRMGTSVPKQYLKIDDKCILEHTVLKLLISPYIRSIVLVLSPEDSFFKFTCLGDLNNVRVVHGGQERVDSVLAGLAAVETPWALVHDAARLMVSLFDIENLLYSVACGQSAGFSGGLLVSKVADTLKLSDHSGDTAGTFPAVKQTVDRNRMYRAQTPQLFKTDELSEAINNALETKTVAITDEASAMESLGHKVMLVEGSPLNFKITEPADFLMIKALMSYCAPNY